MTWNYGLVTLNNCTISHNTAPVGAGIRVNPGSAVLTNCTITNNNAYWRGGAMDIYSWSGPGVSITNCTITENSAGSCGGALSLTQS